MSIPRNLGNFADNVNANGKVEVTGINATGTPSSTTVLYGNGTWAAAGGGSSQWTTTGSDIYYNTGSVGVGTTAPAVSFEVNKSSGEALRVAATGANQNIYSRYIGGSPNTANMYVGVDSAAGGITGNGASGMMWQVGNASLSFGTNNVLRATIDSSGNVGIGTSSPSTRLHAKGTGGTIATFERDASGTIAYFNRNAGSGNAGAIIGADSVAGYFAGGNSTSNMVYLDSVNNLAQFYTNGSERARFNSTGALVFAGGTTTANGIGITFPATQSASTNANTLDDYEEGTYTPVMTFGGGSAGQTVTGASGWYTKVGRLVNFHHYLELSNKGSSTGNAVITGLPFTMDAYGGASLGYVLGITYTGTLAPLVDGTSIYMYQSSSGNASAAITNTAFSSPFRIDLNYTVNVV